MQENSIPEALTLDDVLLVPAHSEVLPRAVKIRTRLTREISLNIPLVSAAMDTVTEARLAIALAQEGGIGIVHKSMSAEAQAESATIGIIPVDAIFSPVRRVTFEVEPTSTTESAVPASRASAITLASSGRSSVR